MFPSCKSARALRMQASTQPHLLHQLVVVDLAIRPSLDVPGVDVLRELGFRAHRPLRDLAIKGTGRPACIWAEPIWLVNTYKRRLTA